jgi:hypothetical protein
MSPTEFELRAALRHGEGGGIDPDRILARAAGFRRERHARRVRAASMSAAAAVIVGVAVTGSVLLHSNSETAANSAGGVASAQSGLDGAGNTGSDAVAGPHTAPSAAQESAASATTGSNAARQAAAIDCPSRLPDLGSDVGGTGSLFGETVAAIKVCAYTTRDGAPITLTDGSTLAVVYTGTSAAQIVASIDDASAEAVPIACPGSPFVLIPRSVVIIGVNADGSAMSPIVASLDTCSKVVSNGILTRYNWTAPPAMAALVVAATHQPAPQVSPPVAHGSPVH